MSVLDEVQPVSTHEMRYNTLTNRHILIAQKVGEEKYAVSPPRVFATDRVVETNSSFATNETVTMIFLLILLTLAAILLLYYRHWNFRRSVVLRGIPGPPSLPIIGNLFDVLVPLADLWDVIHRMNDAYYPIHEVWTFNLSIMNLRHPDDVEVLLTSPRHITKAETYDFLHPWFNTGLLTSTGSKWHKRRKILTPAFHLNIMRDFVNIFDKEGRRMVRDIKDTEGKNEYDILPLITKYTLNTICETAMGTSLEDMTTFHSKYRKAVHDMGEFLYHRLLRPWLHSDFLFNLSPTGRKQKKALEIIHGFSTKIIRERQQYHEDTGGMYLNDHQDSSIYSESKKRLAMLDLLIAAMKEGDIDEAGIREEVDTFMFEGHDTSAMGMCFALLLLAEHKDVQQRAREEIDAVLDKSGGKMDIAEIQQFTYLDRCLKESLRLYPSVPVISRYIGEELPLKNYTLPVGTMADIHIYDVHRDPNFWPDPHTFDPDRFLPERVVGRHPFSYIPFSAGQRNCIGQKFAMFELKAFVGHLLHNFYLEPIDLASEVRFVPDLVLRPTHPIRVRFISR